LNYIDYVIFGVILLGFILGYKDGLVRKIIGLAGVILGIIFAIEFSDELAISVAPLFDNEIYFARIASGVFIFIIIFLFAAILKRIVHPHDKVNKVINQLLGGLTGVLQIIIFLSGLLFFLNLFHYPKEEARKESMMYLPIYQVLPKSVDMVIGGRGILKAYINEQISDSTFAVSDSAKVQIDSSNVKKETKLAKNKLHNKKKIKH